MSFVRRQLSVQFQLGEGSFGASGTNTVMLGAPLRASCTITRAGGFSAMSSLEMRIFGVDISTMNAVSTLGKPIQQVRKNVIIVSAGDVGGKLSPVFAGTIQAAWVDGAAAPDVALTISAFEGLYQNVAPVAPTSYSGSVDVATVLQTLATQMGFAFENSSTPPVSVQLDKPYYPGTALFQAMAAVRAAHINMCIDQGTLAIWPWYGNRGGTPPLISPDNGLVNYPTQTQNGIALTTLWTPEIVFGGTVKVQSSLLTPGLQSPNGLWTIYNVTHELESETYNGKWFTHLECNWNGQPTPVSE